MLKTEVFGISFDNPVVLASGILGVTGSSMHRVVKNGAGAVTIKSLSPEPREGHRNPTMMGTDHFFLNAVGLSNPGIQEGLEEIHAFKRLTSAPLIGSVFAGTRQGFVEISEKIGESPIDILELDLSCPNVGEEFGEPFAYSKEAISEITRGVKAVVPCPVSVKLSPNVWNIGELAQVAEQAGADMITAVNTASGMMIDVRARMPVLANRVGGISGKALFPIALKCVHDVYGSVKIPIIGTGGVTTGEDAFSMIMAGATLVGVGSAVWHRGEDVFQKITDEMKDIMNEEGIASLEEIRGVIHH